jgi:hypothetical protein
MTVFDVVEMTETVSSSSFVTYTRAPSGEMAMLFGLMQMHPTPTGMLCTIAFVLVLTTETT